MDYCPSNNLLNISKGSEFIVLRYILVIQQTNGLINFSDDTSLHANIIGKGVHYYLFTLVDRSSKWKWLLIKIKRGWQGNGRSKCNETNNV